MSSHHIALDADYIRRQIDTLLRENPELADDEELRKDCLEGETDAHKFLERMAAGIREDAALMNGIAELRTSLGERSDAAARRIEARRELAQKIMEAANLRKVVLPAATLSIRETGPAVRILDEKLIPEEFWRIKREPNRVAIKAALLDGGLVAGATLSNGGSTLAIRG
jgi:hypothetical protein